MMTARTPATNFAVLVRLAAFAKASACQHMEASAKPWHRRDRTIQYAAARMMVSTAGDYRMPAGTCHRAALCADPLAGMTMEWNDKDRQ